MSNQENIVDVHVNSSVIRRHRGDSIRVDAGHLLVELDKYPVAIYAPGKWERANLAGNLQETA